MKALVVGLFAATLSMAPSARADDIDKAACVASYEQGQRAKLHSELLDARKELAACATSACPESLRPECVRWLDEVNRAMPSIVLQARGKDGTDKTAVRVLDNGKLLVDRIDGKPIDVDPGPHELRFEAEGEIFPSQNVLVVEGQKGRLVLTEAHRIALAISRRSRPMPLAAWITGGLTLVAAGTFGVFAGVGVSDYNALPACKCGGREDAVRNEFYATDVALGVAVVSLLTTAVLVLTRPTKVGVDHTALLVRF